MIKKSTFCILLWINKKTKPKLKHVNKIGWLIGDAIIQLDNSGGESSESDGEGTEVIVSYQSKR